MSEAMNFPKYYDYPEQPCHNLLKASMKPVLGYIPECDFEEWKQELKERFLSVSGLDQIVQNCSESLNIDIEYREEKEGYTEIRFTYESERGWRVPAYLLLPQGNQKSYPVAMTLQGHSTGFHNSVGKIKYERDIAYASRGQFGIQAVNAGYAAFCIEQRGMGERRPRCGDPDGEFYNACTYTAMKALELGRTILGERVFDIKRGIDALAEAFPKCNTEQVLITGNSGGGTASFYAACYDERIRVCVPSCSFCSYDTSILNIFHCACNYMPAAHRYFEMQDLAGLIYPRQLHIIAGKEDHIFPLEGVKTSYETAKKIYSDIPDACSLTVTPKGHWWCEDIVWSKITSITDRLGWKRGGKNA